MLVSEALYETAAVLERDGWAQGPAAMVVGSGPKCVMGGIGQVTRAGVTEVSSHGLIHDYFAVMQTPIAAALLDYLDRAEHDADDALWMWNDDCEDVTEVTAALRACAVIEAAREDAARESATEHAPALAEAVA